MVLSTTFNSMLIAKKDLEERLASLQQWHAKLIQDLAATDGAMQECEHWIGVLNQEESKVNSDGSK